MKVKGLYYTFEISLNPFSIYCLCIQCFIKLNKTLIFINLITINLGGNFVH